MIHQTTIMHYQIWENIELVVRLSVAFTTTREYVNDWFFLTILLKKRKIVIIYTNINNNDCKKRWSLIEWENDCLLMMTTLLKDDYYI